LLYGDPQNASDGGVIIKGVDPIKPGDSFAVDVRVSSDIDLTNTFYALISFPQDLLEVVSIIKERDMYGYSEVTGTQVSEKPVDSVNNSPDQICAQVVTRACKTENVQCIQAPCPPQRVCKDFPTPCDVPDGWEVESCKPIPPCVYSNPACDIIIDPNDKSWCQPTPSKSPSCQTNADCKNGNVCVVADPWSCNSHNVDSCDAKICVPAKPEPIKDYFIRFWLPDTGFSNENGKIFLSGGTLPGIKTTPGQQPIMATIIFKAKNPGAGKLSFADDSLILRQGDAQNILTGREGLEVNIEDSVVIKGDINGDGTVGYKDLSILLSEWGKKDSKADVNGNGIVDFPDLSLLISNWNEKIN
jgi:hypothetical protein